jgi:hypothetical protein
LRQDFPGFAFFRRLANRKLSVRFLLNHSTLGNVAHINI